jgi:hypothetical protein
MNIVETILGNPQGGTVKLGGGDLPVTGYFVGGVVNPLLIEPDDRPEDVRDNLKFFLEYLAEDTEAVRSVQYVGWWTDEETGRLWVDGTSWHETEYEARRTGWERREIAIFDIERDRELRLAHAEGE